MIRVCQHGQSDVQAGKGEERRWYPWSKRQHTIEVRIEVKDVKGIHPYSEHDKALVISTEGSPVDSPPHPT